MSKTRITVTFDLTLKPGAALPSADDIATYLALITGTGDPDEEWGLTEPLVFLDPLTSSRGREAFPQEGQTP